MLKEWLRGSKKEEVEEAPKPKSRMVVDAEKPLETPENSAERRRELFERKLAEHSKDNHFSPGNQVTYESLYRKVQSILLTGHNNETQQGLTLNVNRSVQNTMVGSKWVLTNPQTSLWELTLQMQGFSDVVSASWNTLNRYTLLYQRVFSSGALLVGQVMAQKQQGMCNGMMVTVLQYPWSFGGCSHLQYVKDQSFSLSHTQRLIRGAYLGSNLTVDPATHESSLSHMLSVTTPKKDAGFVAEITPSKGTWKVAGHAFDWGQSMDAAIELEYKETRDGMRSALNVGCRKGFVGGAQLSAALLGLKTMKVNLHLPFGGEVPGVNQLRMMVDCQYDLSSGTVKQGLVFTA